MQLEAIVSLSFIIDILKSTITDAAKERLKPKTSEQTARKHAFDLYQNLEKLVFTSGEFVAALEKFVHGATNTSIASKNLMLEKESLLNTIDALRDDLKRMTSALENLQPQLNIHLPDVFKSLQGYGTSRSGILDISRRRAELNEFAQRDLLELNAIIATSKNNQKLISKTIDEYRLFLAATFSFKESF